MPDIREKLPMSVAAVFDDGEVRRWVRESEARESARTGVPLPMAREAVARKSGIPSGTLETIRRGRSKGVRAWVVDRLREFVVSELQAEIGRLSHDLEMVRARSGGVESNAEGAARAAVEAARKLVLEARQ